MDDFSKILLFVLVLTAILLAVQFLGPRRFRRFGDEFSHNFGQGIYGTLAAVAIIIAGILYLVEKQWSPRFSVDLKTHTALLPTSDEERRAVIQTLVTIGNQGRTQQKVKGVQLWVVSLQGLPQVDTTPDGDLPGRTIFSYRNPKANIIAPGETDVIAIEAAVPCSEHLVRVLLKVPQPPYKEGLEPGEWRDVYERKMLVSLDEACKDPSTVAETSFQDATVDWQTDPEP